MEKYRKKPVEIEAVQLDGTHTTANDILDWILENGGNANRMYNSVAGYGIQIDTLEGLMTGNPGDYVIRGVQGEFYPCKPDIFELTYDKVTDADH